MKILDFYKISCIFNIESLSPETVWRKKLSKREFDEAPDTRKGDLADQASASLERDLRAFVTSMQAPAIPRSGMTFEEAEMIALNRACRFCGGGIDPRRILVNADTDICGSNQCGKKARN